MNRKQFDEMNVARKKLALRNAGFSSEIPDILDELKQYEWNIQHFGDRYSIIFFLGSRIKHGEAFDNLPDAVQYGALMMAEEP